MQQVSDKRELKADVVVGLIGRTLEHKAAALVHCAHFQRARAKEGLVLAAPHALVGACLRGARHEEQVRAIEVHLMHEIREGLRALGRTIEQLDQGVRRIRRNLGKRCLAEHGAVLHHAVHGLLGGVGIQRP